MHIYTHLHMVEKPCGRELFRFFIAATLIQISVFGWAKQDHNAPWDASAMCTSSSSSWANSSTSGRSAVFILAAARAQPRQCIEVWRRGPPGSGFGARGPRRSREGERGDVRASGDREAGAGSPLPPPPAGTLTCVLVESPKSAPLMVGGLCGVVGCRRAALY